MGWAGLPRTPTTPNRQAHPAIHRHARPRSGAHTRTRLPRLRSGTLSATARLDVRTFTPRSHHHGYRVSPVRRRKATSCRTRSGTHTRLPRLRSGTPSATARLNVWAFHPSITPPRIPGVPGKTREGNVLPDSIRRPHPHSSSPTPIGDPFGYGPVECNDVPPHPDPTGAHKRRPYMTPAGAGPGNNALPHTLPLLVGEGWGEGQSTTPLSSYRGHPVPMMGRSLTRLTGDTRYPRWDALIRLAGLDPVPRGRGARTSINPARPTGTNPYKDV